MIKKLIILVILGVFLIGAFGGCYTSRIPDLSGDWQGRLDSTEVPGVNIRITIEDLTQDLNGRFTGGLITVTYSGSYNNYQLSGSLTAEVYGDSTDEFRARIKARGYVNEGQALFLTSLIQVTTGQPVSFSEGAYYEFAFTFPHMYGCVDGVIDDMIGDYEFTLYQQGAIPGRFDRGTAEIER
jgi:hypothetical protein